jgi:hypothetical protein
MNLGRTLIVLGGLLIVAGLLVSTGARLPFKPGHLPGDFVIRTKNGAFYFPVVTCLLASLVLTLLLALLRRR